MQHTESHKLSLSSIRSQIAILLATLAGLLIAVFAAFDLMTFLIGIREGNPLALALLVSIMGVGFILLSKLGIDFTYKEQIEQAMS